MENWGPVFSLLAVYFTIDYVFEKFVKKYYSFPEGFYKQGKLDPVVDSVDRDRSLFFGSFNTYRFTDTVVFGYAAKPFFALIFGLSSATLIALFKGEYSYFSSPYFWILLGSLCFWALCYEFFVKAVLPIVSVGLWFALLVILVKVLLSYFEPNIPEQVSEDSEVVELGFFYLFIIFTPVWFTLFGVVSLLPVFHFKGTYFIANFLKKYFSHEATLNIITVLSFIVVIAVATVMIVGSIVKL